MMIKLFIVLEEQAHLTLNTSNKILDSYKNYKRISLKKTTDLQAILDLANESIVHNPNRIEKNLISKTNKPLIKPIRFWGNQAEQINFIIQEILKLNLEGKAFNDIAILCRTKNQTNIIIDSFQSAGIPVITNKLGLLNCSPVQDIISWCQLICDGLYQDTALFRIFKNIRLQDYSINF